MSHSTILNFTSAGPERLVQWHGSQAWKLNADRAREAEFLVCAQNRKGSTKFDASEPHGEAFLIGHVADVVPSDRHPDRWRIAISDYARIKIPGAWKSWRFPIRYVTLESLGINLDDLQFTSLTGAREQDASVPRVRREGDWDDVVDAAVEDSGNRDTSWLDHAFQLRPDLRITIKLPADMTAKEADRLAGFVRQLSF